MNQSWEVLNHTRCNSRPVKILSRVLTSRESYVNNRLNGIHKIIESYGGEILFHNQPDIRIPMGGVVENSVCYWNGIALLSRYVPKSEAFPVNGAFDSRVYTLREDFMNDSCMKEIIDFYQADEKRVEELVAENGLPLSLTSKEQMLNLS